MELIQLNLVTTILIRCDRYYSVEYRKAIWSTIRLRSEYEANIRYSPDENCAISPNHATMLTFWKIGY